MVGNVANVTAMPENQVVPWLPCLLTSSRYALVDLFHRRVRQNPKLTERLNTETLPKITAYLPLKSGNKENKRDEQKPLIHHHISIKNLKIKVFHILSNFNFY